MKVCYRFLCSMPRKVNTAFCIHQDTDKGFCLFIIVNNASAVTIFDYTVQLYVVTSLGISNTIRCSAGLLLYLWNATVKKQFQRSLACRYIHLAIPVQKLTGYLHRNTVGTAYHHQIIVIVQIAIRIRTPYFTISIVSDQHTILQCKHLHNIILAVV